MWTGIAAGAVERARLFIRNAARHAERPAAARRRAPHHGKRVAAALRGLIASALRRYEQAADDERTLASLDFQTAINLIKVEASELAVATVMSALRACGLSGYRNDGDFTIGRLSARRAVVADHDQQRSHPRQHRRRPR